MWVLPYTEHDITGYIIQKGLFQRDRQTANDLTDIDKCLFL